MDIDETISAIVEPLDRSYRDHADPSEAERMSRYMRDQFPFLGLKSPTRQALTRDWMVQFRKADEATISGVARRLWTLPEREFQYTACGLLERSATKLSAAALALCRDLLITKSWWDTVDSLASHAVGTLVLRHPEQVRLMDEWLESENMWLRRTALLHQLKYKGRTDTDRLFGYCLARAHESEFFIRKAIGWALRQYSWTDPEAIEAFVAAHEDVLSPLSKREALLAINGGRGGARQSE
ncbi:MAG: DNA alkylation repair protein [Dehalococcoidia bacterium]